MRADNHVVIAMMGLAALIGLLLGVAMSAHPSSETWLFRYQALTAGMLAVLAAVLTVFEMRRSDMRQQKRHEQLMRLNLRGDRLRALRAARPMAEHIRKNAERVAKQITKLDRLRVDLLDVTNQKIRQEIADLASALEAILETEEFNESKDLFPPDMSFNWRIMGMNIERLIGLGRSLEIYASGYQALKRSGNSASNKQEEETFSDVVGTLRAIQPRLVTFADHLDHLAEEYR